MREWVTFAHPPASPLPNHVHRKYCSFDALQMEEHLARLADLVVVIVESPGTFTELGAFSLSPPLRQKMLAIVDAKYHHETSLITNGSVKWIDNESAFRPTIYTHLDQILLAADQVQERIRRIAKPHGTKLEDLATSPKHLLFFMCDLISVIYPATLPMILDYLLEISPTIASNGINVATLVGLAVAMNLLRPIAVTSGKQTDTHYIPTDFLDAWDYRYVWLRDAAFTLCTFLRLGYREDADAFRGWLKHRIDESRNGTRPMQIMYSLAGPSDLKEIELGHLSGFRDSKPVRIGNGAFGQLQLDIYGELMDGVYLYSKYAHAFPHDEWIDAKRILEWLGENWNQPDEGIWEVRGGHRHFLHSRLMCWVAFDRVIRLAHRRSLSAPLDGWYRHRDAIVEDIYANFWSERLSAFVQEKNSEALDASVLLMPIMRFISPIDPRWLSTMKAIEESLAEDAFVYRYRNLETQDGLEGEEGSLTCCSFWLVECLARANQVEKARSYFDKLLCHSNHLGLFSEEIARDGHQLGNFPQALTHLALISAAISLDRTLSGTLTEPWN